MSVPGRETPADRPQRVEPVEMSLEEKLACEREARHDVAARGRIADVAPVQHYLEHSRTEDGLHPSNGGQRKARRPHERPARGAQLGWLRWGEDGPPSQTPHFPPV